MRDPMRSRLLPLIVGLAVLFFGFWFIRLLLNVQRMLRGEYREWNQINVAALSQCAQALTQGNRAVLEAFSRARHAATPWGRVAWLRRSGAFRQKPSEQAMLWLACVLRRM